MSFGFIIPSCCKKDIHLRQLHRCIESIRKYHRETIIIINDSDEKYNIEESLKIYNNLYVKKSSVRGSGDQQIFKFFLENIFFEKAIFIQDSMILNKKLKDIEKINNIKFIWHCTNHRIHWDVIKEPVSDYNRKNRIINHTDLLKHYINKDYKNYPEFINFCVKKLTSEKNSWCSSIGCISIINKKDIKFINDKINFSEIFCRYNTNRLRRVNESVFPLLCHYFFNNVNFEDSYDGLYYDGKNHRGKSYLINKKTGFDNLVWCSVHDYFSKISFNR